ncbi:MAG: hypothetical protein ABW061_19955 [Polyangiaceae bacterium]
MKRALIGLTPLLAIGAVATGVARHPLATAAFGAATFVAGATMLWYGRDPKRAVLPGLLAGFVPLLLVLCTSHLHGCMGDSCMMVCVPACSAGGLVAGLAVASVGNQRNAGSAFWLSASAVALLTGSMGCGCVGYSGVAGLAIGFAAGMVPGLLRRAFARTG